MKIRPLVTSSVIIVIILFNSLGFQLLTSRATQAPGNSDAPGASFQTHAPGPSVRMSAAPPSAGPTPYADSSTGAPPVSALALEQTSGSNTYPAYVMYAHSVGPYLAYMHDTNAPGRWNTIGAPGADDYLIGDFMAGDYGKLYVLSFYNNELHTLNTTTLTDTLIGASVPISGHVWTGMTGAANGALYASSTDDTASYLYTLDASTGAATVVGEITNSPCIGGIAINTSNEMYGMEVCNDVLVQIDPSSGAGTVIGPLGLDLPMVVQGMDFAPNGVLYLALLRSSGGEYVGQLQIADTSTGNLTFVGSFPDNLHVPILAFARPMSGAVQLLQNPGFEDGWAYWTTYGYPSLSGTSHSGSSAVWFYGEDEGMWQEVYIPADAIYATLSYWIYGTSEEPDFGDDLLCLNLLDQTAQTSFIKYCWDLENLSFFTLVWKRIFYTLPASIVQQIAGQTVLVRFEQTQEDWGPYAFESNSNVDDVALNVYLPPGPLVTGITPASGSNDESLHVTHLAGDFFQAGASVQLVRDGQTPIVATNVAVLGETQITCDLDLTGAATGQWDVVVTNSNAQSGTLPGGFTVTDPFPTVSSITPDGGANSGVVSITDLAGDNFLAGASVKLSKSGQADINATNVNVLSENQITCDLDLTGAATGLWDVVVTNTDAQSGTLPGGFRISSKVWNGSASSDWHTAANWTPSGVPTISDDVFIPDIANDPIISGGDAAVKSLVVAAGAVLDLTSRVLTVEDALNNAGTLKQTLDVTTGETTNFLRITNQAGDQTRYYGLDLTPTGAATTLKEPAPSLQAEPRISYHRETGQARFLGSQPSAPLARPKTLAPDAPAEVAARAYLDLYGSLFGLRDQARELRVLRDEARDGGRNFTRFQQTHRGVPIVGGELIVQTNAQRELVSINGEVLPDLALDVTPGLSAARARQIALNKVARDYGLDVSALQASEPDLWIYNPTLLGGPGPRFDALVWRTEVTPLALAPIRELVLVDAQLGAIALHFNQVDTARNRQTYDAGNSETLPGTLVCGETSPTCSGGDAHEVAAHTFAGETYNFYAAEHGRDSIDGAGMTLISTVHYRTDYNNAFWNGAQMVYGDGADYPLADDVVAHELTHGVTDYESSLFYFYQSGAINESLSDIWGEFVDLEQATSNDAGDTRWAMGEDVEAGGTGAIRSMQDPTLFGDPDRMSSSYYVCSQSDLSSGAGDNGGVHSNSGVSNKAAYLMTDGDTFNGQTVTGLGYAKVADLYYEVQTNLLTSAADYADLYDALLQACNNLGYSAADCQEVQKALNAVEMNQQPPGCPAPEAPVCDSGTPEDLFFDDLESGGGNWTEGIIAGAVEYWFAPHSTQNLGLSGPYSTSGVDNIWGFSQGAPLGGASDTYLAMNSDVSLPAKAYLHFAHSYGFESESNLSAYYDGGVLEYSTNGGGAWNDAGALFDHNGYNGTLASGYGNPLAGRSAFAADSRGYISSRLDLASLAGQNVRFRFRMGTDSEVYDYGWFIDDVRIYTCAVANTAPTISGLPDQALAMNSSRDNAIDLWTYASDADSGDAELTFSLDNSPDPGAGVSIDSNQYIDINPSAGWTGQTDVVIRVSDPGGLYATDTFQVNVILDVDKTWNGSVSSDWHSAANWTPSGAPTSGDDVLIPDTANDPVVSDGDAAVNNLIIAPGAVLELTNRALTVEGALTNNGALGQEQRVRAGSAANLLRITNLAGDQTKYYGLDLTPAATPLAAQGSETAQASSASAHIFQAPGGARSGGQPLAPIMLLPNGASAFAAEVLNDDLVSFDTDTPATLNTVANLGANYFGGDFLYGDFSKLYALDYLANNFVSIDTATAAVTVIGTATPSSGHIWTGLAGDPTDGTLYGSSTSESASTLYTFDVSSGTPTTVSTVSNAPGLIGIAINAAGEMYGLDIVNDVLVRIDKTTGAGTVLGAVGFNADYAQGMDFDEEADVLYLAAYNADAGRAELRVADTITGGTTLVGVFPASTEIDALAIATGGNTAPVAVNDVYTTTQDTPLGVAAPGVLGNDVDGDPLTAGLDIGPVNGVVNLNPDGSFTYTPTAGFSGADSFIYHANDGVSDSNLGRAVINVTPVASTPPVLAGLPDQNVPLDGSVDNAIDLWSYASDAQDADGDLSFAIVNSPTVSAGVSLDSNRYVDIMPAPGWTGVTDVEVQVQDTDGLTATDSFQVNVSSVFSSTSVTVAVSGNQRCPGRASGVKRCFDITPASVLTATVRFYLSEAERDDYVLDELLVLHQAGDWIEEPGPYTRGGVGDAQYVQAQNVDDFSLFALDSDAINVHVLVYGHQFCPERYTGVRRCFDVTPSAALTATVRFYFDEAERDGQVLDDLLVYRYGVSWIEETGPYTRGGAGDAQYVQAQGVQDLTLFALDWFSANNAVFLPMVQRRQTSSIWRVRQE